MLFKKHIPNAITCANLFCGCLAIVNAFQGELNWTAYLVGIAAVLDFFDGFSARMLKTYSTIGKDLDSLADMVTFGVVPGVVMFQLCNLAFVRESMDDFGSFGTFGRLWTGYNSIQYLSYVAFSITIFSCLRLAKFNNDSRQTDSFIGLPTPANSILICSFPLIMESNEMFTYYFLNPYLIVILSCLLSLLLVSEIPLFSLKFKKFGWANNGLRYIFLAISLLFLILFHYVGIPLIIVFYILLSIVNNIFLKTKV
jgi:CDP-diacylglycerol---serine O-phosphatidyltransferase